MVTTTDENAPEPWQALRWAAKRAEQFGDRQASAELAAPYYALKNEILAMIGKPEREFHTCERST